ncbi:MAG: methyltransferase domain-containing protein, partial [Verrucomicrobia bacterium]|nr:methyltransferase domain-containing protein [Verrucomicrobiota bacterium]
MRRKTSAGWTCRRCRRFNRGSSLCRCCSRRTSFSLWTDSVEGCLPADDAGVVAALRHQFRVGAALTDAPVFEHQNLVQVADGGEPVGDDQRGAAPHQPLEAFDHERLALGVERTGRFVEQEDGRVLQEGAREVEALPFADASFDAVVSADVVCQVENPEAAAAEFMRVLRPGGVMVINVPAYRWMWSYHDDSCQTKHRYTR